MRVEKSMPPTLTLTVMFTHGDTERMANLVTVAKPSSTPLKKFNSTTKFIKLRVEVVIPV